MKRSKTGVYTAVYRGHDIRIERRLLPEGGWRLQIDGRVIANFGLLREADKAVKRHLGAAT